MFLAMPKLPTELDLQIIEEYRDDPSTLSILTLVCKSWLHASRFHLLRKVHVTAMTLAMTAFFCSLTHYLPRESFGPYIQELYLSSLMYQCFDSYAEKPFFASPPFEIHALASVLHMLPRLQILVVSNLRLVGKVFQLPSNRPSLTFLAIQSALYIEDSVDDLLAFISLFSSVDTLSLNLSSDFPSIGMRYYASGEEFLDALFKQTTIRSLTARAMPPLWALPSYGSTRLQDLSRSALEAINLWPRADLANIAYIGALVQSAAKLLSPVRTVRINLMHRDGETYSKYSTP